MLTQLSPRALAAVVGIVAIATSVLAPASASWADPAGTLTLTVGDAARQKVDLEDSDGGTLLYSAQAVDIHRVPSGLSKYWTVTPPAAPVAVPDMGSDFPTHSLAGSLITAFEFTTSDSIFRYRTVDGATSGSWTVPPDYLPVTGSPNGYLLTKYDDAAQSVHLYNKRISDGVLVDLGKLPTTGTNDEFGFAQGEANATGVVLQYFSAASNRLYYMSFATPGVFTPLAAAGSDDFQGLTLGPDAVGWLENAYTGAATAVRAPLSGAASVTYPAAYAASVALTEAQTGWVTHRFATEPDVLKFKTAPAAGGASTVWSSPDPVDDPVVGRIEALGTKFALVVDDTDEASNGGLSIWHVLNAMPTSLGAEIAHISPSPTTAAAVAVGPGRAAWTDNASPSVSLRSNVLTGIGPTLSNGVASVLAAGAGTTSQLAVSGRRTAYVAPDDVDPMDDALRVHTAGGSMQKVGTVDPFGRVQLSGTRLLYQPATGGWRLKDLVSGVVTTLASTHVVDYALWGNYLAFAKDDGSVWRRNLVSSSDTLVRAALPTTTTAPYGRVAIAGDYVAWALGFCAAGGGTCNGGETAYRNVKTMAPATLVETGVDAFDDVDAGIAMSAAYLLRLPLSGGLEATRLSNNSSSVLSDSVRQQLNPEAPPFSIVGSRVAWLTDDESARVGDLTHVSEPPRYLGNPSAPTSFEPSVQSWQAEFVVSTAMPTCSVLIKSGATVVRTLSCVNTDGGIQVAWDGKDAGGSAAPAGPYTWTLTGSNSDGAVQNYDGTSTAITGPVQLIRSGYEALTPKRLMDTRDGTGVRRGLVAAGATVTLPIPNVPSGATAVALNVTATGGTASTFISVCPGETTATNCKKSSSFNPKDSKAVANLVLVKLGSGSSLNTIKFYNNAGSIHLIADVQGFQLGKAYAAATTPTRIMDTRDGTGAGVPDAPVGAGQTVTLSGLTVPAGATAVALNVTATGGTANSYVSVCPGETTATNCKKSSNFNPPAHTSVANLVLVQLTPTNTVTFYNNSGSIELIADLQGFEIGSAYSAPSPTSPTRVMDTRDGTGAGVPKGAVPPAGTVTLTVPGVPAGATAVVLNVTATAGTASTFISVCPGGTAKASCSASSNFNPPAGASIAVLVLAKLGPSNTVTFYNNTGNVHLIADAQGYLQPPA